MAQFMDLSFRGQDRVHLMPVQVTLPEDLAASGERVRAQELPVSRAENGLFRPVLPNTQNFLQVFGNLAAEYDEIFVLLSAAWLTGSFHQAEKAVEQYSGAARIEMIDSEAISVGLGMLVSMAAELADDGKSARQIKMEILGALPHIYAMFCVRSLSYLEPLELIEKPQAAIGEMLGVTQAFYVNNGKMIPVQKIRNPRHMIECVQEFVSEFADPRHIALLHGSAGFRQEVRSLRERILQDYPEVQITEHNISLQLGSLLGPQTFGLFLWEQNE